jgi:hypothetical protein
MRRPFSWLMLGMACWLGSPSAARASCNAIAPASELGLKRRSKIEQDFPYRGALGRINRVYSSGGEIVVVPDAVCATSAKTSFDDVDKDGRVTAKDVVVSVSTSLPDADWQVRGAETQSKDADITTLAVQLYASEPLCESIVHADGRLGPARVACTSYGIAVETPSAAETPPPGFRIRIALPTPLPTPSDAARQKEIPGTDPLTGALTVLVVKGGADGATRLQDAYRELTKGDCATLSQQASNNGVYVCIDKIYRDGTGNARCELGRAAVDPYTCHPANLPETSFSDQCACKCSNQQSPRCQCTEAPNGNCRKKSKQYTKWYVDTCVGGIHATFNWEHVYANPPGRRVSGFTAAGRNGDNWSSLRIKGLHREFLGSSAPGPTPTFAPGPTPTTGRSLPDFDVLEDPTPRAQEAGLTGVIDEEKSTLHIFPRFPVNLVCSSNSSQREGCVALIKQGSVFKAACACAEDLPTDNTCSCAPADPNDKDKGEFFACSGGDFAGIPCTRRAHCGSGQCDGKPTCQKSGPEGVWREGLPPSTTPECSTDAACAAVPDHPQCGYALFDFSSKFDRPHDKKDRFVTLEREVTRLGKKRRGVCPDGRACSRERPCAPMAQCSGYSLQAEELR